MIENGALESDIYLYYLIGVFEFDVHLNIKCFCPAFAMPTFQFRSISTIALN